MPARRVPEAVERLLELHRRDGRPGEAASAFFRRLEVSQVRALLADLETLTAEDAAPDDYVDLAEEKAFVPEVLEGECSA